MKILLLKGALFMTMPLSLGAFMLGQGAGFFSGGLMGGYMMLRAANRYHKSEKVKWGGGGGGSAYTSGWGGWSPPAPVIKPTEQHYGWGGDGKKHEAAFKKGVFKGKAIVAAIKGTKKGLTALTHVLRGVQSGLAASLSKKPVQSHGGWGWQGSHSAPHSHHVAPHSAHGYSASKVPQSYSAPVVSHSAPPIGYGYGPPEPEYSPEYGASPGQPQYASAGYGSGPAHGTSVDYMGAYSSPVHSSGFVQNVVAPTVIQYEHYPNNGYRRNSDAYQTIFSHPNSDESSVDLGTGYKGPGHQYTGEKYESTNIASLISL